MKKLFLFFLILSMMLAGCSMSEADVKSKAPLKVQSELAKEGMEPNEKIGSYQLFLPFGMKVKENTKNNIFLKKGSQTYLLFINKNEGLDSQVLYQQSTMQDDNVIVNETFEKEGKFGYLLVTKVQEKEYEVIVGIGGIKMTTVTTLNDVVEQAELMMRVVDSIQWS
ncbi:MAG: hypothetical protein H0Z31_09995 [Bacillus sp. (in: Bacteria)]|nr:hypothetical protein [Bacillus sp. (in: firmicutes)]